MWDRDPEDPDQNTEMLSGLYAFTTFLFLFLFTVFCLCLCLCLLPPSLPSSFCPSVHPSLLALPSSLPYNVQVHFKSSRLLEYVRCDCCGHWDSEHDFKLEHGEPDLRRDSSTAAGTELGCVSSEHSVILGSKVLGA